MNIKHLTILVLIAITPFIGPMIQHANAISSICNLAGENSTAIKKCVDGYMKYQKMNHSTDSQMQQILDENRHTLRSEQKLQDPNQTQAWVESKSKLSEQMLTNQVYQRDWYYQYMNQNLQKMNEQIKWWKTYDHNIIPVPQTCPKWHDCAVVTYTSNYTKVELKPEFTNHTSGIINNPTPISNWYQLEKWLEAKNQTKN